MGGPKTTRAGPRKSWVSQVTTGTTVTPLAQGEHAGAGGAPGA